MNEVTYMPCIDRSSIIMGSKVRLMGEGRTLIANQGVLAPEFAHFSSLFISYKLLVNLNI